MKVNCCWSLSLSQHFLDWKGHKLEDKETRCNNVAKIKYILNFFESATLTCIWIKINIIHAKYGLLLHHSWYDYYPLKKNVK